MCVYMFLYMNINGIKEIKEKAGYISGEVLLLNQEEEKRMKD